MNTFCQLFIPVSVSTEVLSRVIYCDWRVYDAIKYLAKLAVPKLCHFMGRYDWPALANFKVIQYYSNPILFCNKTKLPIVPQAIKI